MKMNTAPLVVELQLRGKGVYIFILFCLYCSNFIIKIYLAKERI